MHMPCNVFSCSFDLTCQNARVHSVKYLCFIDEKETIEREDGKGKSWLKLSFWKSDGGKLAIRIRLR